MLNRSWQQAVMRKEICSSLLTSLLENPKILTFWLDTGFLHNPLTKFQMPMEKVPFSKTDKSTRIRTRRVFFLLYRNYWLQICSSKTNNQASSLWSELIHCIPPLHVNSTNFLYKITLVSNIQHSSEQVLYILSQQFWQDEYLATGKPETMSMSEPICVGRMIILHLENFLTSWKLNSSWRKTMCHGVKISEWNMKKWNLYRV
jgi:hypothetical protein